MKWRVLAGAALGIALLAWMLQVRLSATRADPAGGSTASGSVHVTASIAGVRLLVVDDRGTLLEVWSNTSDDRAPVRARRGAVNGPVVQPPRGAIDQYRALVAARGGLPGLGRVYSAPVAAPTP